MPRRRVRTPSADADGDLAGRQGGGRPHPRPTITSLLLASAPTRTKVRWFATRSARSAFVASEPLAVSGPNPPNVRLATEDCSGDNLSGHGYHDAVAARIRRTRLSGTSRWTTPLSAARRARCLECACKSLGDGSRRERAGQRRDLHRFGALLTNAQPGWLFFDNAVAPSASALLEKVPASCADSSVGSADCLALSTATPLGPGSWFKAQLRATRHGGAPGEFSADATRHTHRTRVPPADPICSPGGCVNAAPATECEAYAVTSRRVRGVSVPRLRVSTQPRRILRLLPDGSRRRHGIHRVSVVPVARGGQCSTST